LKKSLDRVSKIFFTLKETIFKQINEFGTSNKKVYQFLLQKTKILPIKHQNKWCDILVLQLDSSSVN